VLYAGQFNIPYNFSLLAHRVTRGVEWADPETKKNPSIISFMDKVLSQPDADFSRESQKLRETDPKTRPAKVQVTARGGKTFTHQIKYRRGDTYTDVCWTQEEAVAKFKHNVERVLTKDKAARATKGLLELEHLENIATLMKDLSY
jgi:2-methylcitrate dehydratase PrpD